MKPHTSKLELPIRELIKFHPGTPFLVYYAKDDNPEHVRFDMERQTVKSIAKVSDNTWDVCTREGEDWSVEDDGHMDLNCASQSGRGYAYFYYPATRTVLRVIK